MGASVPKSALTTRDEALVNVRPTPAKVTTLDKLPSGSLSEVVMDAARRVYGKQAAAAAQLGKDEGNFSRDAKAGRLTTAQIEALGPQVLAELGKELVEQYGPLSDPKAHARQTCDQLQALVNILRQFVENA